MKTLMLNVPLYAQANPNSCWHAAAYMIWLYSQQKTGRAGPMATHSQAYAISQTTPLKYGQYKQFANQVGLKSLPKKATHSTDDLHGYLQSHGPIWCNGTWFGVGHAIVLTGISGTQVYFNDPDGGVKKNNTLNWWNNKLYSDFDDTLMYKDPTRY